MLGAQVDGALLAEDNIEKKKNPASLTLRG